MEIWTSKFSPKRREPFCFYFYYLACYLDKVRSHMERPSSLLTAYQTSSSLVGDDLVEDSLVEIAF